MTPLQEYNAITNTAADLLAALDKLDATNSSIHKIQVKDLRKKLHTQIRIVRLTPAQVPPDKAKKTPKPFNNNYSHLAR